MAHEIEPILLSIDDTNTFPDDIRGYRGIFDYMSLESFLEALQSDQTLRNHLLNPALSRPFLIILDEYILKHDIGLALYQALGKHLLQYSKQPDQIYIIGNAQQEYIVQTNRYGKELYPYTHRVDRIIGVIQQAKNIIEIFNEDGYTTPTGVVAYRTFEEIDKFYNNTYLSDIEPQVRSILTPSIKQQIQNFLPQISSLKRLFIP